MIKSIEELRSHYNQPSERAVKKELLSLEKHSINYIHHSPFCVISTISEKGKMDASPRGGEPGFVKIFDEKTMLIPDSRGNNRLDSLQNIVETKSVGLLFMIPGINETLRLNGKAEISVDDKHLSFFKDEKFPTLAVIVIRIEELFLHCAKAFMRSKLWDVDAQTEATQFPSMGEMLKDQIKSEDPAETREDMIKRYKKSL